MTTLPSLSKLSVPRAKLHLAVRAFLFVLLLAVVGGVYALTLPMAIDQVTGVWDTSSATAATIGGFPDVISGSTWNDISCAQTGAVGGETQIGWGSSGSSCPAGLDRSQSRFGFSGSANLSTSPDEYMLLGRFTHYNNTIFADYVLGYINLNITLNFNPATGASPNPVTIPVQIQLDETPNNQEVCPYGGACSDAIFVSLPDDPIPVTIDGLPFSMLDVGFVPASEVCPATPGQSPETHYVSPEGGSNSACVYAAIRFTGQSSIAVDAQPETQTVPLNSSANLTFTVTNTGSGPVQNVSVTHPLCAPAYTSGDSNSDGLLDLNESWVYSCATSPIAASSVTNVTVNADDLNGAPVSPASDSLTINIPSPTPTDSPTDVPTAVPTGVPPTQAPSIVPPTVQASATAAPVIGVFDPGMSKIGYLPEGSLGLPGEAVNWDITISNYGAAPGSNVIVVDELRPELQIDGVTLGKGTYTVSGQTVTITIPTLAPGEEVLVTIATTVLSRPDDLVFTNTAVMPGTDETAAASLRVRPAPQAMDAPGMIMPLAASTPNPITGPIPQVDGAPTPTVEVFPGRQVCWDEDFSNGGTLPGFGPYMILILDPMLTFDSAEFYHLNLTPVFTGTFPAAPGNQLTDPIADEVITGPAGHTMLVLRLPIGSVVTGGPLLQTHFCVTVDPAAPINVPLPIEVIGGYEFGDTATGVNGPILNTPDPDTGSITPILVTFDKSNSTPENERPPGPMWEYSYFLTIELAPGKTLTNIAFNDTLSPYFQFTNLILPPTGTCTPTLGSPTLPSTSAPGGTLIVPFSQIVNPDPANTCTLVIEYTGYITDILDEVGNSPDVMDIENNATFDYSYLSTPGPQLSDDDHVSAEHTVFQKSASPATVQPGSTVNYSVNLQITEYGTVAALTITDIMSDGVDYVAGSGNLVVGSYSGAITPTITINGDGTLTLVFDITALSGNIPPGSGTLAYQGTVRQYYRDGSGNNSPDPVLAADPLPNTVTGNFTLTDGSVFQNTSSASVVVDPISLTKEVISTPANGIGYEPGEPVTYRLTVQIPSGDTQDVVLRDYFPLPVFDVDHPTLGLQVGGSNVTLPQLNSSGPCAVTCGIRLGPLHSTPGLGITADLIAIDPATNSLEIHWPDIDTDPTAPQTLQFDITIAITDDPFADGLHLSNISRINTENTPNDGLTDGDIVDINVSAPALDITKGVSASSNAAADATISPLPSVLPVDGNISQSDAGDVITYVITVENTGGAPAYDVRVTDPPVTGLTGCVIISVLNGASTPLAYTGDLFSTPLVLAAPLPSSSAGNAATALITVRCTLAANTSPGQPPIVNTATASWRAQATSGTSFPSISDDASVTLSQPATAKTVTPTTATIGEVVTYTITTTLPDGVLNDVSIADTLPSGMAFVDCVSVTASAGVSTTLPGGFAAACNDPTNPVVANPGQLATWDFDNITTTPSSGAGAHTITISYTAVVLNESAVNRGDTLQNSAVLNWTDTLNVPHSLTPAQTTVTVIEPTLQVVKTATPANSAIIDADDILTYTLVISHTGASNATAYEVELADNIPANTTYVAGSVTHFAGVAPDTGSLQYDSLNNRIVATWVGLNVGQTSTIRFQVRINNNVQPGLVIANTAETQWTSRPGSPTNTTYNPNGVERTGDPSDPGGAANTYRDTDSVNRTIDPPDISKVVFSTSPPETDDGNGGDGDPDLTIGEQVTYRVTVTFREGVTNGPTPNGAQIIDLLPILPAALRYDSSQIISIGSNLSTSTSISVGQSGVASDRNSDTILDTTTWTLGSVTNTPDGTANASDQIVVEIVATVLNIPGNTGVNPPGQASNVVNTGRLRYVNSDGATRTADATATVDIVEPRLIITKTVTPTNADAGDTVTYTVTVENTGTATAFNVSVTDPLLVKVPLTAGTVTTNITGAGVHGTAAVTTGNTPGDTTIQVDLDVLRVGQTLTVTYQGTLTSAVIPGESLVNTASEQYNSLPDNSGRGCSTANPAIVPSCSDTATVTVVAPAFVKNLVSSSEPSTTDPNLTIGETATFQMTVTVPEGTTNTLSMVDILPSIGAGDPGTLSYVSSRIVSIGGNTTVGATSGGNIANVGMAVGAAGSAFGQSITFNLASSGAITNVFDNITDARDLIIIEVVARVVDIPENVNGDLLTNTATLTYDNGTVSDTADVRIVEPALNITKTASPTSGVNAGDTITYTLVVTHTGSSTATAFDVDIADLIPTGLTYVAGSLTNTAGVVPTTIVDTGAPNLVITWTSIPLGQSSTITYQATVNNTVTHNQSFVNTADLDWSSLPGTDPNEREYDDDDDATVTANLTPLAFTKTIDSTSAPSTGAGQHDPAITDLTIGETVTYELRATLREGTIGPVTITDTLPAGFVFVSAALAPDNGANISIPGGFPTIAAGTPSPIIINLGSVINAADGTNDTDDDLVILITARVDDVASNEGVTGVNHTNTAVFNWGGGTITDTEDVEIVEPALNITKTASPTSGVNAGDTITYTLVVTHTGSSTATAFDVDIADLIPTGLTYVPGTLTHNSGVAPTTLVDTGAPNLVITWASIPLGQSSTITYQATVNNTVTHNQSFVNTADLDWSSLPGTDPNEREYTDDDDATVTANLTPLAFTKTIDSTSEASTGAGQHDPAITDLTIGETVTYELRATLREGTIGPVTVTDTLPAGFVFVSAALAPDNGANISIPGGFPTIAAGTPSPITINLGSVINAADGLNTAADDLVILITARVADVASNEGVTGVNHTNTAVFNWGGGTITDTEDVEIVEPALNITKTASPTSNVNAGDTITYTLVISHTAASTSTAFDVDIADLIPTGLTYVPGTLTHNSGVAPTTIVDTGAPNLVITWTSIPLGQSSTITYQATVNNTVTHNQSFVNTADLDWSSLPGTDPNEREYDDDDDATVTANLTPLAFTKTIDSTSAPSTGAGQHDPAITDLTIGETVTYELRATLREGTIGPVTVTDTLPAGFVFVSAALAPDNGANISIPGGFPTIPAGTTSPITINLGSVINAADGLNTAADDLVILITARVDDVASNEGVTGVNHTNTAVFDWGDGTITDTEDVEIVEPALNITKGISPTTIVDAGDTITYTLTVSHTTNSTATAFNVTISDTLPTTIGSLLAVNYTASSLDLTASTCDTTAGGLTQDFSALPVVEFTMPQFTLADSSCTIVYNVTVSNDARASTTYSNLALIEEYTTLPNSPDDRTNNPTTTVSEDFTTGTPSLVKVITATSLPETTDTQFTPAVDANIGETVTYQLTATLPEGTTPVTVTDNLPDVMTVVSSRIVSYGSQIVTTGLPAVGTSGAHNNVNFPGDGLPDQVVFSLGNVINQSDNTSNSGDTIVFEIVARVADNAANVAGDLLTNNATVNYGTGTTPPSSEDVDVTEPVLEIDKTAPVVTGVAGDIIPFTLTISHDSTSTGPAYDLVITDPLLPQYDLVVGSVTASNGAVVVLGNTAGDTTIRVTKALLNLGDSFTITYQATINSSAVPNTDLINTATLNYNSAPNNEGRPGTDSDDHTIRVNQTTGGTYQYVKSLVATSLADTGNGAHTNLEDLTIGETATYELSAYLPEGLTNPFRITDNLPDGMIVVSSQVLAVGSNLSGNTLIVGDAGVANDVNNPGDGFDDQVVFDFGAITNVVDGVDDARDLIVVQVVARMHDTPLNADGQVKTNTAIFDYGLTQRTSEVSVEVVEPNIELTKQFIPDVQGRGHTVQVELVMTNNGTSIAYNLNLTDQLHALLDLQAVNFTLPGGTTATDNSTLGYGGLLDVVFNQLRPGESITVTLDLLIDPATTPLPQTLNNTADVDYQSIPAGHPDEPHARDYTTDADDTLLIDRPTVIIEKTVSLPEVFPGEAIIYTITVTNTGSPDIDATDVTVTDLLPPYISVASAVPDQGTCDPVVGNVLVCHLGDLPSLAPAENTTRITINALVETNAPGGSILENFARVTTAEDNYDDDAANITIRIPASPVTPTPAPTQIAPPQTGGPICSVGCVPWQVYHTNRTGNWEIFRLGTYAGASNANLTQHTADDMDPGLSPDGSWMAFASNRDGNWEIYVTPTNGDTSQAQRVTYNTIALDTDPAWGPGNSLVYQSTRDGNWELYLFNLTTGAETRLTNDDAADMNPYWAPDGSNVIFQSNRDGQWQIYRLDLGTLRLTRLSDGSAQDIDPAYSPDGSQIVFRSYQGEGNSVLHIMNASGSGRYAFSDVNGDASNAAWSPQGRLIAYQSDLDGDLDIYVYDVVSRVTRHLTDNEIPDYAPTWVCGQTEVIFTSDISGNPDIYSAEALNLEDPPILVDQDAQQLTDDLADDVYPLGAPSEEMASREGRLPADLDASRGQTSFLNPDVTPTPPDLTLVPSLPWQRIEPCV